MKRPSLTIILIASMVALFGIVASFTMYSQFVLLNNASVDPSLQQYIVGINSSYGDMIDVANSTGDQNLVTKIFGLGTSAITGTFNIFVVGLESLKKFFDVVPVIRNIMNLTEALFPGLSGLIGLFIVVVVFYISMRSIQSARGTPIQS